MRPAYYGPPVALYFSNWSSHKTTGHHGLGRKLTIMCKPRKWEHGDGCVETLTPREDDLDDYKAGRIDLVEYRRRYMVLIQSNIGRAGMWQYTGSDGLLHLVHEGDTLCCACSRAAAERGECHRVWAAVYLANMGGFWADSIVLDGKRL